MYQDPLISAAPLVFIVLACGIASLLILAASIFRESLARRSSHPNQGSKGPEGNCGVCVTSVLGAGVVGTEPSVPGGVPGAPFCVAQLPQAV